MSARCETAHIAIDLDWATACIRLHQSCTEPWCTCDCHKDQT